MDLVSIYFAEATCPCDLVEMGRLYAENASLYGRNLTNCRNDCTAPKAYITSELTVNKTVLLTTIAGTRILPKLPAMIVRAGPSDRRNVPVLGA